MKQKKSTASGGVGISGLLQVAFIVLKLCGVIDWGWWWVLSPTWISLGLVILLIVMAVILMALADLM